ncbi:MAG: C10 family peptidase [Candidatus Aminicenantes bacterium]|nr:C10 family peptidase [Candidatus Aminicenantes bacterium]
MDLDIRGSTIKINANFIDAPDRTDFYFSKNNKVMLTSSYSPPLLQTNWHQGEPYWNFCPKLGGKRCYVGCTATAMVQIMRYYQWPNNGEGSHTYYWSAGGRYLSVDFSDDYDWGYMPHNTEDYDTDREKNAVAELCYEAGVSVDMNYGPEGSGAYVFDVEDALEDHFRYLDKIKVVYRKDYGNVNLWFNELKKQRDLSQPVEFAMYSTDSGHAVVIDGYLITSGLNQVHINMGWGGSYNAYYTLDDILDYTETYWQHAVIDIIPPHEIKLNKSSLSFTGTEGQASPNPQKFQVRNSGFGKMEYQITPDEDWISTSPTQGESSGEWDIITVNINISDLLEGTYSGDIKISSQGARNSPLYIDVSLTVKPPPIYPPLNFSGKKVKNTSGFQIEYINVLSWQENSLNRHIEKYRIYISNSENEELLTELDAGTIEYLHRNVIGLDTYKYYLKAVDYKNREGEAAYIQVK